METVKKVLVTIVLLALLVLVTIMSYKSVCSLADGFFGDPAVEEVQEDSAE